MTAPPSPSPDAAPDFSETELAAAQLANVAEDVIKGLAALGRAIVASVERRQQEQAETRSRIEQARQYLRRTGQ